MTTLQNYLDSGLTVLEKLGIKLVEGDESKLVTLLEEVRDVDEAKVSAIAQTVKYMGTFNRMVRDNVEDMNVGQRYQGITDSFDSIIEDSKAFVEQLSDGRVDFREKMRNILIKWTRGTTHDRFENIRKTYLAVQKDTKEQIDKEEDVLNGYVDYRLAVKRAGILAFELKAIQEKDLEDTRQELEKVAKKVGDYKGEDQAELGKLNIARDEAKREYETQERRYDLIKDVAENLSVGHNVADTLMAKLKQTHDAKQAVYRRSVAFFETNDTVFATLDMMFTARHGLYEATKAQEAMTKGVDKSLEAIADLTDEFEKAALKAGYGATFSADSVQKLIDSVVSYQIESRKLIQQYRKEATDNAKVISQGVQEAHKALTSTITKYTPA